MGKWRPSNFPWDHEVKNILIAAALIIASGLCSAQNKTPESNLYGELGYSKVELRDSVNSSSPDHDVFTAIIGYRMHPNLSAEVLLGTGLGDKTSNGLETKIDYTTALILRPSYKFNEKFEAFARLGYGRSKLKASMAGIGSGSATENSALYGVGANYYFTNQVYGQLNYTSFFDKDGVTGRGFGAAIGYKF